MTGSPPHSTGERAAGSFQPPPGREAQELWLVLSRRTWRSVVLVPGDRGASAATSAAAAALAEVGRRLRFAPVTALLADDLDYDATGQLVRRIAALRAPHAGPGASPEQLVLSIPAVAAQPLGVAVAREADAVVVCIELGRTSLASARKTVELIGLDRLAGCLLLT